MQNSHNFTTGLPVDAMFFKYDTNRDNKTANIYAVFKCICNDDNSIGRRKQ